MGKWVICHFHLRYNTSAQNGRSYRTWGKFRETRAAGGVVDGICLFPAYEKKSPKCE